jgi:cytochrome c
VAQPKRLVLVLLAAMMPKGAEEAGNPVSGERVFQYCYSCHAVDPNEKATLQGPGLHAIVGKRIAAQTGFDYSLALRALAERHDVWSEDLLDRYIASPESVVPKTTMNFGGLEDPQERADLIALLKAQLQ